MKRLYFILGICFSTACSLFAQPVNSSQSNVTGQLILTRTVNLLQQAQLLKSMSLLRGGGAVAEAPPAIPAKRLIPRSLKAAAGGLSLPSMQSLAVSSTFTGSGFNGITHRDQRLANNNNQFSIEPPSPSIAVGNGLVLEGVNNAVEVYTASGTPLLPHTVSSNQVFGLAPAIDRTTNIYGPYPTDMRVFYDPGIDRWFILQRSQDNDIFRNLLNSSRLYMAVSQTGDPTGTYNIYTMDTTNGGNRGCPCLPDYLQVGADQYGFYISANEFNTFNGQFVDATILAISKSSLGSGAGLPAAYQFMLRQFTGYESTIFPATTPPGANYFVASKGVEYFVSSLPSFGNNLAVWAMSNTSSLDTANPKPALAQIIVPTLTYIAPNNATQRPGPLPYGSTLNPPGSLANVDGGDNRVLSVSYSGGRLYVTLATQVIDEGGRLLAGGAYVILSPTLRNDVLACFALRQGYLLVKNNHLLRPAIAVNPQGRGAVAFTLVGPDYYPSAAFVPVDTFSTGSTIQIAGPGVLPEDGFTGYPGGFGTGAARWGDYSAAVAAGDGSIWMTAEYIPNALRTEFANWGTFLMRYSF